MALGTRPVFSRPPWLALEGTILEAQATTTPGRWFPLLGYFPLSITVEGTFVGQVNILVSNAEPPPTDDLVDTMQLGDPGGITGPNFPPLVINAPFRWIKAQVVSISSGTIRGVYLFGTGPMGSPRGF